MVPFLPTVADPEFNKKNYEGVVPEYTNDLGQQFTATFFY